MAEMPIACTLSRDAHERRRDDSTRIAAYGGIYIAASLPWLWAIEQQRPTPTDVASAALAILGAVVIIGFAARHQP